jgi:bifunctional UDP-N-acetylglucosamine pyrophosphorylase/glucosamine-1-phosphate N-acetyltransferase
LGAQPALVTLDTPVTTPPEGVQPVRQNQLALVILAAGEGTRMRSRTPKVLHGFAGRSLLGHVLAAATELDAGHTAVVVGHGREQVTAHLAEICPDATPVVQAEQNGTGHAVRLALDALPATVGTVVVLPGDVPLLTGTTLQALVHEHDSSGAAATMLTSRPADPSGYGRVVRDQHTAVRRIVEHRDASEDELLIDEVATSVYAFEAAALRSVIGTLSTANAQGEEYLTDVIDLLVRAGHRVGAVLADAAETAGVNDRVQLTEVHYAYNARLLEAHMRAGVTVVDPASTWVDAEVTLEPDVTLLPSVDLHGRTHVAAGASIGPQTSLTDTTVGPDSSVERAVAREARIGAGVSVGPFAYLRPGTVLDDGVHIGTYVEVKNSDIGKQTKVPHLTYVGDATIGARGNIGAATVFVNYDGVTKSRSIVGDDVRTGADNMFVAPVQIGDGAYTAAGAVITKDVPPGALGRSTARQENVAGWVQRKRPGTAAADAAERAEATDADTDGKKNT